MASPFAISLSILLKLTDSSGSLAGNICLSVLISSIYLLRGRQSQINLFDLADIDDASHTAETIQIRPAPDRDTHRRKQGIACVNATGVVIENQALYGRWLEQTTAAPA